jgi:hypothetical protein
MALAPNVRFGSIAETRRKADRCLLWVESGHSYGVVLKGASEPMTDVDKVFEHMGHSGQTDAACPEFGRLII